MVASRCDGEAAPDRPCRELSRVAGNLNQMNRAINEGRLTASDAAGAGRMLMELRGQVDQLRRLLIGQEVLDESEG
jgi:hypothetical protein